MNLKEILEESDSYFIQYKGMAKISAGNKLSIQGKTLDDALELAKRLTPLMNASHCTFKFGTQKLISSQNTEQSTKLLTIYIPDGVDPKSFAELVSLNLKMYKGGEGIPPKLGYEYYENKYSKGAIYYRNDRDSEGNYIYPENA